MGIDKMLLILMPLWTLLTNPDHFSIWKKNRSTMVFSVSANALFVTDVQRGFKAAVLLRSVSNTCFPGISTHVS